MLVYLRIKWILYDRKVSLSFDLCLFQLEIMNSSICLVDVHIDVQYHKHRAG